MRTGRAVQAATVVLMLAACARGAAPGADGPTAQAGLRSPTPSTDPSPASTPSPIPAGTPGDVAFHGTISAIDAGTVTRMIGTSWHAGCPVPIDDLRLLTLDYRGFDGAVRRGSLIVNASVARGVVSVFRALFDAGFPIRRMEPVDAFGGHDDRSMAADNTSGFNCRAVTGDPGVWSQHAYGLAVDVDPRENPYVVGGSILPPAGARFADRSLRAPGMIHAGDAVVRAFASVGWRWGGDWSTVQDYQHFSADGR